MANTRESLKVLLVGNPNCGKSTLFNSLCGGDAKVGNYTGVTVERKSGQFSYAGVTVVVEDLPGLYSLTPSSEEEAIVRDILGAGDYDLILNVLDSSNLERNLFLTLQLSEMGLPMAVVLNMTDELEKNGEQVDVKKFEEILNIPAFRSIAHNRISTSALKDFILRASARDIKPAFIWQNFKDYPLYREISELSHLIKSNLPDDSASWSRWFAIMAIEGDRQICEVLEKKSKALSRIVSDTRADIEKNYSETPANLIAAARFSLASKIAKSCLVKMRDVASQKSGYFLDKIFLNRYLGLPIFLLMMFLTFQIVFTLGDPLMSMMEDFFSYIAGALDSTWSGDGAFKRLVIEGIIGGVGGVLVFLPNILLLFLILSILEDSGYMARAAFLCDKLMRKFGLSGASLIPMLVGFGCSVPAIMATRALKSRRERLASIMVLPLFSCGARLPVYLLLIPTFFAAKYSGFIMFGLYLFGIALALLFAKILRASVFKGGESGLVLELPKYRLPRLKNTLLQIWDRAIAFLKRAGTLILGASVLLWIASNYPVNSEISEGFAQKIAEVQKSNLPESEKLENIEKLRSEEIVANFEYTLSGRFGNFLEPVLKPIGFDKKISSALIGALAAKEVFVSQLGIVYGEGDADESDTSSLRAKIAKDYTPLQGLSILLFVLISMPCIATIATSYNETRSKLFAFAQVAGLTGLAYAICFVVYQVGLRL